MREDYLFKLNVKGLKPGTTKARQQLFTHSLVFFNNLTFPSNIQNVMHDNDSISFLKINQ